MAEVSIIMPVYNSSAFLPKAIESVLDQTYSDWELIVVDDGSTDNSSAIIKQYAEKDTRIIYLYQENGRQGKARNLGLSKAGGKYIAFLDADDSWVPHKLALQTEQLIKHENIALIFSQGYFSKNGELTDFDVLIKDQWSIEDFGSFLLFNQVPILSVLVRKDALEHVGNFNESDAIQNAEDYHLWLKLLLAGYKMKSIPQRLFNYRVHDQQVTFNKDMQVVNFNVLADIYDHAPLKQQKMIISKFKWYIFGTDLKVESILLIKKHLAAVSNRVTTNVIISLISSGREIIKKTGFRLLRLYA